MPRQLLFGPLLCAVCAYFHRSLTLTMSSNLLHYSRSYHKPIARTRTRTSRPYCRRAVHVRSNFQQIFLTSRGIYPYLWHQCVKEDFLRHRLTITINNTYYNNIFLLFYYLKNTASMYYINQQAYACISAFYCCCKYSS